MSYPNPHPHPHPHPHPYPASNAQPRDQQPQPRMSTSPTKPAPQPIPHPYPPAYKTASSSAAAAPSSARGGHSGTITAMTVGTGPVHINGQQHANEIARGGRGGPWHGGASSEAWQDPIDGGGYTGTRGAADGYATYGRDTGGKDGTGPSMGNANPPTSIISNDYDYSDTGASATVYGTNSPQRNYHNRFNRPSVDEGQAYNVGKYSAQPHSQSQSQPQSQSASQTHSQSQSLSYAPGTSVSPYPPQPDARYQPFEPSNDPTHLHSADMQKSASQSSTAALVPSAAMPGISRPPPTRADARMRSEKDDEDQNFGLPKQQGTTADQTLTTQPPIMVKGPKIGKNEYAEGWTKADEDAEREYVANGMFNWKELMNWRFWIRKKWWYWYLIIIVLCVLVGLMSLYKDDIIRWLTPVSEWMKDLPGGWAIPIAVLTVLNFPPLFGQEIVCLLCGLVWGLWWGFGIVAAAILTGTGTMIGEILLFFAMKYCLRSYAIRLEEKNPNYACLAHVVRNGGFFILFVIRFSAVPGHFSTAVFATAGVGFWVFTLATFLTLPKQLILVYLGTISQTDKEAQTKDTTEKIVTYITLIVGLLLTVGSMWYIYRAMKKAKLIIWRRERLAQKAEQAASSPLDANASPSSSSGALDQDISLHPTNSGGAKVNRRISYREMLEQPNDDIEALAPMLGSVPEHGDGHSQGQRQGQGSGRYGWGNWGYGTSREEQQRQQYQQQDGQGSVYDPYDPPTSQRGPGHAGGNKQAGTRRVTILFFPIPRVNDQALDSQEVNVEKGSKDVAIAVTTGLNDMEKTRNSPGSKGMKGGLAEEEADDEEETVEVLLTARGRMRNPTPVKFAVPAISIQDMSVSPDLGVPPECHEGVDRGKKGRSIPEKGTDTDIAPAFTGGANGKIKEGPTREEGKALAALVQPAMVGMGRMMAQITVPVRQSAEDGPNDEESLEDGDGEQDRRESVDRCAIGIREGDDEIFEPALVDSAALPPETPAQEEDHWDRRDARMSCAAEH